MPFSRFFEAKRVARRAAGVDANGPSRGGTVSAGPQRPFWWHRAMLLLCLDWGMFLHAMSCAGLAWLSTVDEFNNTS